MITQLIEKIIPKKVTVEQIHAEFDSGEQRILDECDKILNELKIPTESKIERKAKMLQELGFTNSETVKQAEKIFQRNDRIDNIKKITEEEANSIRHFKKYYPFEKFITINELDKICDKYNLIYAPVTNYIKDIPEKNILEMKNCKPLFIHEKNWNYYSVIYQIHESTNNYNQIPKKFRKGKFVAGCYSSYPDIYEFISKYLKISKNGLKLCQYSEERKINTSTLFIAAPKSHFNLDKLSKESKFGFFQEEVKDPVVFEFCNNNIVRIITKWGTPDDKSYLDETLQNEILN